MAKSELELIIDEIKSNTKQVSINKVDEVRVMKSMLNDKDFKLSVYDKSRGYIGQKCPHDSAVEFIKGIIQTATGLDSKDSRHLADNYEFTKTDAVFLLDNAKDFLGIYLGTGRKINVVQTDVAESNLYARPIPESTKSIPDKDGNVKKIHTNAYTKIVSVSKCPKYNNK